MGYTRTPWTIMRVTEASGIVPTTKQGHEGKGQPQLLLVMMPVNASSETCLLLKLCSCTSVSVCVGLQNASVSFCM